MTVLQPTTSKSAWIRKNEDSDVTSLRFSPSGRSLAVGCFNGNVYIRSSQESRLMYRIQAVSSESPITSLRWHPVIPNSIVAVSASGFVSAWHTETGQRLWGFQEEDNSLNTIDFSPNGSLFSTAGSDCSVRTYNLATRQLTSKLETKLYMQGEVSGHENRIFSVIYLDNNTIASSGWDNTIIIWDLRSGEVTRSIFGTQICGESMVSPSFNQIISGSWRDDKQLQVWDVGTGNNISTTSIDFGEEPLQVYSLSLSSNKQMLACSGSGLNAAAFYRTRDIKYLAQTERFEVCANVVALCDEYYAVGLANSTVYCDFNTVKLV